MNTADSMKKMRMTYPLIIIALLTACTQTPTKTEFDKSTDFSKLKSYAWGNNTISIEKTGKTVDRVVEDIGETVKANLQTLVNQELAAKGYTLTDNQKPDFIVQYSAKTKVEKIVTREMYAPGAATSPSNIDQSGTLQMGTLIVYILEPVTMKLLWRAQTDTIMKFDGKTENRLKRVVAKMFNDFPPKH